MFNRLLTSNARQALTSAFIIVRAILGLYNAFSILAFRNGVERAFGRHTANWYLILQATQFHIIYYASRTLPNMFAFGMSITDTGPVVCFRVADSFRYACFARLSSSSTIPI